MASPQAQNLALRRLVSETGWTEEELARAVNAAGREAGLQLRYNRSSVSHWLSGRRPWVPVPSLIAETLTRRLSRPIGLADIGMATRPAQFALITGPDIPEELAELARYGSGRGGAYSLARLAVPEWDQAVARWPARAVPPAGQPRLLPGHVAVAEQMTPIFTDTDAASGGGRSRAALAAYLAHDIAPWVRAPARKPLRGRLLAVATRLAYLCAFMCYDDEQHVLAQRYYRTSLDLATENGDQVAYAIGLRGLSVQARSLGHHREALQLAEVAASSARRHCPAWRQAFFLGQVAVAAAAGGDRHNAMSALTAAERMLNRASSAAGRDGPELIGNYHPASLAHQQAAVRALLGDRAGAIAALSYSITRRPRGERRSRAITTARLAELQLDHGRLDEATVTWHAFLDEYPYLRSGRATAALRTLRSRLRPHVANRPAAVLLSRAAGLT